MLDIIKDLSSKKELIGLEDFFENFLRKELKHNIELKKLIKLPIKQLKKKKIYKEFLKKSLLITDPFPANTRFSL